MTKEQYLISRERLLKEVTVIETRLKSLEEEYLKFFPIQPKEKHKFFHRRVKKSKLVSLGIKTVHSLEVTSDGTILVKVVSYDPENEKGWDYILFHHSQKIK